MIKIGTFAYRLGRCQACHSQRQQVTRWSGMNSEPWTCLSCVTSNQWFHNMQSAGQAIITLAFEQAEYELRADAECDASLRRLLAPVEARLGGAA